MTRHIRVPLMVALLTLLIVGSLMLPPFRGRVQAVELLTNASQQMVIPQPGQTAHYTTIVYNRVPPAGLEPADPYHLPYADIWRERQIEETWLEISPEGKTIRWRTQLHSTSGKLLQDLVFDGQVEVDYFPTLGRVETRPETTVGTFTDNRIALLQLFLQQSDRLTRRDNSIDGRQVTSVQLTSIPLPKNGDTDVTSALLGFQNPFVADLKPVALKSRIDFDPGTLVAIGTAQVVSDLSGHETIVTYRTLSDPELLAGDDPRLIDLFTLNLPLGITPDQDRGWLPSHETLSNLSEIASLVNFPIYGLPEELHGFRLVSVDYTPMDGQIEIPIEFRSIYFAPSQGTGVRTVYAVPTKNSDATAPAATITLIQGVRDQMTRSMQATRPAWLKAHPSDLILGNQRFSGWVLGEESTQPLRFVIETPHTLIYLEATGLTVEQLHGLLSQMSMIN